MKESKRFTVGVVAGVFGVVGMAWAFAVTAAEHVMNPHLESAKQRVHVMCMWARVQDENIASICEATGAKCQRIDVRILMESCEER